MVMAGVRVLLMVWAFVCIDATSLNMTLPPTTNPPTTSPPTTRPVITLQAVAKYVDNVLNSPSYNSRLRPGTDDVPLDVYININVNDISYISETQMEYSMTLFVRQIWIDERLAYGNTGFTSTVTLNYKWFEQLWTPDLYVANLKSGVFHKITVPNRRFRLSPNGQVYFSQRISVTMYCDMVLARFPMDNQTCFLELGTYAYPTTDLLFHWRLDAVPVEMTRVSLPEYVITNISSEVCTPIYPGAYPCLRAYFYLSRRLKKYLLSTYLPSFLLVFLSWVSFYIDPASTPARVSLGIITILVLTTQNSGLVGGLPAGSVTKATDVWMAACLVFVFGAFIEFAVVDNLTRRRKRKMEADDLRNANGGKDLEGLEDEKGSSCGRRGGCWSHFDFKRDPGMALDRVSRIFFPVTFLLFCLFYWPIYLFDFTWE